MFCFLLFLLQMCVKSCVEWSCRCPHGARRRTDQTHFKAIAPGIIVRNWDFITNPIVIVIVAIGFIKVPIDSSALIQWNIAKVPFGSIQPSRPSQQDGTNGTQKL